MKHRRILTEERQIIAIGLAFAAMAALYVALQVIW